MANSPAPRAGKRERLVQSATILIHEQGVHRTTLAGVAERADVPLGNVYYYFKTKDELVRAVLAGYEHEADVLISTWDRHPTPQARLKALVHNWSEMRELVARYGCPMGSLVAELDKLGPVGDRDAAAVMGRIIEWAEGQFQQLGRQDARELAEILFAGIQGAALLAGAFHDAAVFTRQARHLERWIETMDESSATV